MAPRRDYLTECDHCRRMMVPMRTSADGDSTEYGCRRCGYFHTLKASRPGEAFAFFPEDIRACITPDLKPLFPQIGRR
jgi:hypothetical protein